jgi:integrase
MQQQTYRAVVGMLAVTGLRVGEAIRLGSDDVCLRTCIVRVIGTKFGKSREVPLDPSSAEALGAYVESRDLWWPQPCDESFFLSTTGTTLSYSRVRSTFQTLVQRAGLRPRDGRCRPRLHDLRHTVACKILVEWHRDGLDVQSRLPLLSTFLGHGKPEDTYWYLSAVPELLGQVARRLEDTFEDGR